MCVFSEQGNKNRTQFKVCACTVCTVCWYRMCKSLQEAPRVNSHNHAWQMWALQISFGFVCQHAHVVALNHNFYFLLLACLWTPLLCIYAAVKLAFLCSIISPSSKHSVVFGLLMGLSGEYKSNSIKIDAIHDRENFPPLYVRVHAHVSAVR